MGPIQNAAKALFLMPLLATTSASSAQLLRETVDVGKAKQTDRRLGTVVCPSAPKPLLWKVEKGNATVAYLVGSAEIPYSSVQPLPQVIEQALSCADVAYFPQACSKSKGGGMGHFMTHCYIYPASDEHETVSKRLSEEELANVRAAMLHLVTEAPHVCTAAAAALKESVGQMASPEFRTTLQTLYRQAFRAIDPQSCQLDGAVEPPVASLEDALRSRFSGRPIWGLEDVSMDCRKFQGNSQYQDKQLSLKMVSEFTNPEWLKNASTVQDDMAEVIQCGNMAKLAAGGGLVTLPDYETSTIARRNAVIAQGINSAVSENVGKTVLVVLNVQHLFDAGGEVGSRGVPAVLEANGFRVQLATGPMQCPASSDSGKGAEELDKCMRPAFNRQPASCRSFRKIFNEKLAAGSNDSMYGRHKDTSNCGCVNASEPCTCQVLWSNTTGYDQLCALTTVGGVRGQVMEMDLTRNPGSRRLGRRDSAKVVRTLFEYCYATSCNMELAQENALRQWYKRDGSLSQGFVTIRPKGSNPDDYRYEIIGVNGAGSKSGVPSPFGSNWSFWTWGLAVVLMALVIIMLVACFRLPKRKSNSRPLSLGLGRGPASNKNMQDVYNDSYEELKPLADPQSQAPQDDWQRRDRYQPNQQNQKDQYQQHQQSFQQSQQFRRQPQHQQQSYQQPAPQQYQPQPPTQQFQQLPPTQQFQQQHPTQHQQFPPHQQQDQQLSQPHWTYPPSQPDTSSQAFDTSLLQQAYQMQQALGDAGAQAVHQMQMNSLQHMGLQNLSPSSSMVYPGQSTSGQSLPPQGTLPTQTSYYTVADTRQYGQMAATQPQQPSSPTAAQQLQYGYATMPQYRGYGN